MQAKIAGMVLRARVKQSTARFYEVLGLSLMEHEHGGPMHFEMGPNAEDLVFEIYKGSTNFSEDALMVEVDSLDEALQICEQFDIFPLDEIKEGGGIRFAYIADPDDRSVMLLEKVRRPAI